MKGWSKIRKKDKEEERKCVGKRTKALARVVLGEGRR